MSRFIDNFYGPDTNPVLGIQKLHSMIIKDINEAEGLITFIKQRIAIEQLYSTKLVELKNKMLSTTVLDDMDSKTTTVVYRQYMEQTGILGDCHISMAETFAQLYPPIESFIDGCKKTMVPRAEAIHNGWIKYEKLKNEALSLEAIASKKFEDFEHYLEIDLHANEGIEPIADEGQLIQVGGRTMSIDSFNDLLSKMQSKVQCEDIWKMLGTLKECYQGQDLLKYLITDLSWTEATSREFLDDLINQGFIKPISGRGPFTTVVSYQWKKLALEALNEPPHKKQRREAHRAAFEASRTGNQVESFRMSLDSMMFEYIQLSHPILHEHIRLIKDTLLSMVDVEKISVVAIKQLEDQLGAFLESLDASKEVKAIPETERTGLRPPTVFVPKRFPSTEESRVFGVPLEIHTAALKLRVPPIIRKCLSYLDDTFALNSSDPTKRSSHLDAWLEPNINLAAIHSLRQALNSGTCSRKDLRKFPPEVIVGVVKQYLIELPDSVCCFDIYESLKMIYLSKTDDSTANRLNSIRNLLATMPTSHFYTLAHLTAYWSSLINHLPSTDPKISHLANSLGSYVLRPEVMLRI
ncbi:Rho GTPase activation protein [Globomyces pollinis-pini]|nr:Rho GTPase activation protein [Globomyces pollinis-pini]